MTHDTFCFLSYESPPLRYVNVSHCDGVNDEAVRRIAVGANTDLRRLVLKGCHNVTDRALTAVSRHCPRLQSVDVTGCQVTDSGLHTVVHSLQDLEHLRIGSLPSMQSNVRQQNTRLSPRLRLRLRLCLRQCISSFCIWFRVFSFFCACFYYYFHFYLYFCLWCSTPFRCLLSWPYPGTVPSPCFPLSLPVQISNKGMRHLAHLSALCHLEVVSCRRLSSHGFDWLPSCSTLLLLRMDGCEGVGPDVLDHVLQCRRLRLLSAVRCRRVAALTADVAEKLASAGIVTVFEEEVAAEGYGPASPMAVARASAGAGAGSASAGSGTRGAGRVRAGAGAGAAGSSSSSAAGRHTGNVAAGGVLSAAKASGTGHIGAAPASSSSSSSSSAAAAAAAAASSAAVDGSDREHG